MFQLSTDLPELKRIPFLAGRDVGLGPYSVSTIEASHIADTAGPDFRIRNERGESKWERIMASHVE
jgi:hypothetical protein